MAHDAWLVRGSGTSPPQVTRRHSQLFPMTLNVYTWLEGPVLVSGLGASSPPNMMLYFPTVVIVCPDLGVGTSPDDLSLTQTKGCGFSKGKITEWL